MRLSPEKSLHLARLVTARLLARAKAGAPAAMSGGEAQVKGSEHAVRQRVLDTIRAFLDRDEEMAEAARQKIRSVKRNIPEGSAEWDALFRQHYHHELERLRKVR